MKKQTKKELKELEKKQDEINKANFKSSLPIELLKLLAEATVLNIDYKIVDNKGEPVIYMAMERFKSVQIEYNGEDIVFNYIKGDEWDFNIMKNIIIETKNEIAIEKERQEKIIKARQKAKNLLTEEERELLGIIV